MGIRTPASDRLRIAVASLGRRAGDPALWPVCNGRRLTAVHVGRCRLPLCARCSGLVAGLGATSLALMAVAPFVSPGADHPLRENLALVILATVLFGLDGWRSYHTAAGSTNIIRAATGLFFGASLSLYLGHW